MEPKTEGFTFAVILTIATILFFGVALLLDLAK